MSKFINGVITLLFMLSVSFGSVLIYDKTILTPRINSKTYHTVDIERVFASYEVKVRKGDMKLEEYSKLVAVMHDVIGSYNFVINKNIVINGRDYPVVFGGIDITDEVLQRMDEAQ